VSCRRSLRETAEDTRSHSHKKGEYSLNMMQMKFKDFTWKNNPVELVMGLARNIKEIVIPYVGTKTDDMGEIKRKVSGRGYFTGEVCMEEFNRLQKTFQEGGAGSLHLPGQMPFAAVMQELKFIGVQGENIVEYSFLFKETEGARAAEKSGVYTARNGESLWDYSFMSGVDIETMRESNTHIRNINYLNEGDEVIVP